MLIVKQKNNLVLCEGSTQGLGNAEITAEAKYSVNFMETKKKFCSSLHFNGSNSTKIYTFKAKYYYI